MTKRFFLVVSFLLISLSFLAAQDQNESIEKQFDKYRELSIAKDYSGLMDFIYPKLFTVVPREQMVAMFEQMDGEEMSFEFKELTMDNLSEVFVHEEEQFALVDYTGKMTIWFLSEEMQDEATMEIMEATFANTYDKIERVDKDGTPGLDMEFQKQMFAIADQDSEDWKFIENNAEQAMLMEMLFPKEVIDHFAKKADEEEDKE